MNYAIIRSGGKQFRVKEGDKIRVPRLESSVGETIDVEALMTGGEDDSKIGTPAVETKVKATIVDHERGEKLIIFKKKRRKQYKRKQGHRQGYTTLEIGSIGTASRKRK